MIEYTIDQFLKIKFQDGFSDKVGVNGVTVEDVLKIGLSRLKELDDKLTCHDNFVAISAIETALAALEQRTLDRLKRGVEGTDKP